MPSSRCGVYNPPPANQRRPGAITHVLHLTTTGFAWGRESARDATAARRVCDNQQRELHTNGYALVVNRDNRCIPLLVDHPPAHLVPIHSGLAPNLQNLPEHIAAPGWVLVLPGGRLSFCANACERETHPATTTGHLFSSAHFHFFPSSSSPNPITINHEPSPSPHLHQHHSSTISIVPIPLSPRRHVCGASFAPAAPDQRCRRPPFLPPPSSRAHDNPPMEP